MPGSPSLTASEAAPSAWRKGSGLPCGAGGLWWGGAGPQLLLRRLGVGGGGRALARLSASVPRSTPGRAERLRQNGTLRHPGRPRAPATRFWGSQSCRERPRRSASSPFPVPPFPSCAPAPSAPQPPIPPAGASRLSLRLLSLRPSPRGAPRAPQGAGAPSRRARAGLGPGRWAAEGPVPAPQPGSARRTEGRSGPPPGRAAAMLERQGGGGVAGSATASDRGEVTSPLSGSCSGSRCRVSNGPPAPAGAPSALHPRAPTPPLRLHPRDSQPLDRVCAEKGLSWWG